MPRGDKSKYTPKQKRKAEHIEESYEARGLDPGEAEARAWATVNKQSGGGERAGSGRETSAAQKARARKDSAPRGGGQARSSGESRAHDGTPYTAHIRLRFERALHPHGARPPAGPALWL
jgi:plasmid stabilization system protein ParE